MLKALPSYSLGLHFPLGVHLMYETIKSMHSTLLPFLFRMGLELRLIISHL